MRTFLAGLVVARELPLATFNTKDFLDFVEYDELVLMS
jgi:hypothetical protein